MLRKLPLVTACISIIIFPSISGYPADKPQAEDDHYRIQASAKAISNSEIEFNVKTNIPLPVEVDAGVDLRNQKPNDTYIGHSERITLTQSSQSFTINTSNKKLPSGEYDAVVTFYPSWGAENGNPKAALIKEEISSSTRIRLAGTGESANSVQKRTKLQSWVMENVSVGTKWEEQKFVSKLGKYEEIEVTCRNPRIIKAYYFPKADMTMIVNIYKTRVQTWRKGKASC